MNQDHGLLQIQLRQDQFDYRKLLHSVGKVISRENQASCLHLTFSFIFMHLLSPLALYMSVLHYFQVVVHINGVF